MNLSLRDEDSGALGLDRFWLNRRHRRHRRIGDDYVPFLTANPNCSDTPACLRAGCDLMFPHFQLVLPDEPLNPFSCVAIISTFITVLIATTSSP